MSVFLNQVYLKVWLFDTWHSDSINLFWI